MDHDNDFQFDLSTLRHALLDFNHDEGTWEEINLALDRVVERIQPQNIDDPVIAQTIHKGPYVGPLLHEVLWNCGNYWLSSASGLSWTTLLLSRGADPNHTHLGMGSIGILVRAIVESASVSADLTPIARLLIEAGADPWNGLYEHYRVKEGVEGLEKLLVFRDQQGLADYLLPLMRQQMARDDAAAIDQATMQPAASTPRRSL